MLQIYIKKINYPYRRELAKTGEDKEPLGSTHLAKTGYKEHEFHDGCAL